MPVFFSKIRNIQTGFSNLKREIPLPKGIKGPLKLPRRHYSFQLSGADPPFFR